MNKIPIVISSDNNIFFTVGVTLTSLLENANNNTFYEINCLCTSDVSEDNKSKLEKLKDKYTNFSLTFYDMGNKFKDLKTTEGYHVNYVSAYKMLIPEMFPQYDKILYLDTDILVRGDLTEFYNFRIDNNYIASTPVLVNFIANYDYLKNMLEIPSLDFYCNAGVMLMNLEQIRKDNIATKWINLLGTYEGSVDQHILNKVCYGKTAFLPLRFNVCLSDIPFYKSNEIGIFYSLSEAKNALENPIIFHWAGVEKPWKYYDTFLAQEWMQYYKKSNFYDENIIRNKCNYFKEEHIRKIKFYVWNFPIFKIKKNVLMNKKKPHYRDVYYLFSIIKLFSRRIWKGK